MPIRLLILFVCCWYSGSLLWSQPDRADLLNRLEEAAADTAKVSVLIGLGTSYISDDADSSKYFYEQALDLSRQLNHTQGEVKAMYRIGLFYNFIGEREKERQFIEEGIALAKQYESDWIGPLYSHLGNIYYRELKYDSAYQTYLEAEKMNFEYNRAYSNWVTYFAIYRLFVKQGKIDQAANYLEQAYDITKARGKRRDFGWLLTKCIDFYQVNKMWDKYSAIMEEYLQFSKKRSQSADDDRLHKILFAYTDKDPKEVIEEVEASIPYFIKGNYDLSLLESYYFLGEQKRIIGDIDGAIEIYLAAIPLSQKMKNKLDEAEQYKAIYELYEIKEDYSAAFPYLRKYQQTIDSLNNVDIQKNMGELQVKYETAKKDQALAQQQLDLEKSNQARQRFSILAVAGSVIALIALWFLYFKNKTNRLLTNQNQKIEKALGEKEILLKEIHHRVKNNLQVISSLLNWQSRYIEDHKALASMQEGRNRVQSMALIHQNLYQTDNLTGVEVSNYIDKLGNSLFRSYSINRDKITFKSEVEPLNLDVDTLIPLGLILNELLSNALKHAFPDDREGQLSVKLEKQAESLLLEVKDDGVGMSKDQEAQSKDSFGYKLVEAFAEKLKAQLQIEHDTGTTVRLLIQDFKLT